ncbi:hypothetical protein IF1G_00927 [Cordyceps javanica]|uniref:Uncharacterized protein n=1 Tax=Cordyceps javanica TaxID=43265 RepID=A0A545VH07_9HYPO|nr:hypothetical protein IF1G_00927 [Cordyceps javanica]
MLSAGTANGSHDSRSSILYKGLGFPLLRLRQFSRPHRRQSSPTPIHPRHPPAALSALHLKTLIFVLHTISNPVFGCPLATLPMLTVSSHGSNRSEARDDNLWNTLPRAQRLASFSPWASVAADLGRLINSYKPIMPLSEFAAKQQHQTLCVVTGTGQIDHSDLDMSTPHASFLPAFRDHHFDHAYATWRGE